MIKASTTSSKPVGSVASTAAELGSSSASSTIAATTVATSSAVISSSTYEHHEDRLSRTWRSLVHHVIAATSKAERAVMIQSSGSTSVEDATTATKNALRDVDKLIVEFLRARIEWSRLISTLEAKLEGKVEEMENIQQYVRCQPVLGMRKRKRMSCETTAMTTEVAQHSDSPLQTTSIATPGNTTMMTPIGFDTTTATAASASKFSVSPLISTVNIPSVDKEMQN